MLLTVTESDYSLYRRFHQNKVRINYHLLHTLEEEA